MRTYWLGVAVMAAGAGLASFSIAHHQVYLVPLDCFTFVMGVFTVRPGP